MIFTPTNNMVVNCYVGADFLVSIDMGLHRTHNMGKEHNKVSY